MNIYGLKKKKKELRQKLLEEENKNISSAKTINVLIHKINSLSNKIKEKRK